VTHNKEGNQESNQERKQKPNQQPARAGAAAAALWEPIQTGQQDDASRIANQFWGYLGSPANLKPSKWVKPFSELLSLYPNLDELIRYAFEKEPKRKFRANLCQADHPVAYLKSVLEHIDSSHDRWEDIVQRHAAGQKRRSAADGGNSLTDNKESESDRRTVSGVLYKRFNDIEDGDSWCRLDSHGNPDGWLDSEEVKRLGLEDPVPASPVEKITDPEGEEGSGQEAPSGSNEIEIVEGLE
jgi:hypothetical protein